MYEFAGKYEFGRRFDFSIQLSFFDFSIENWFINRSTTRPETATTHFM